MSLKQKAVVFGIGAMGSALVKGWIKTKMLSSSNVTAVEVDPKKRWEAAKRLKIRATDDMASALKNASLIVLAVKPQQMKVLLTQAGPKFPKKALVVTIAAGISTKQVERHLPQGNSVVRVMPNTPALLGAGMAAVAAGSRAKTSHVKLVLELFSAVGQAVKVSEKDMDLVTALSGSGPAYFFHLIEAMCEAGVKGGLDSKTALQLAAQTAYGAARMALESGKSPEELRIQVTSPGGTTQAGLTVMGERGFKETVLAAVEAATRRGTELGRLNN